MACSMALSWTRMHWLGNYFIRKLSTITHNNSVKMWLAIDTYFNQSITDQLRLLLPLLHPFNNLFSKTTWVSRYQKGKTSLDLNKARGDGVWGCSGISWTICKQSAPRSRQITTPTPHDFLTPNQQCQSTEGTQTSWRESIKKECYSNGRDSYISAATKIDPPYSPDGTIPISTRCICVIWSTNIWVTKSLET